MNTTSKLQQIAAAFTMPRALTVASAFRGIQKSLALAIVFGMGGHALLKADCLTSISTGSLANFTMVTVKNYASGTPDATYTTGTFGISNGGSYIYGSSETAASSGNTQLFSDRTDPVGCPYLVCPYQPFDINQPSTLGVSVTKTLPGIFGGQATTYSGRFTGSVYGNESFTLTCDATTGILSGNVDSHTHVAITIGTPYGPPQ